MKKIAILLSGLLLFVTANTSMATPPTSDDHVALANIKVGKGLFLVDIGNPCKLNFYLEVIQESFQE